MTLSRVNLESFDADNAPSPQQNADYEQGFEAGITQASLAQEAERQRAVTDLAATLGDMAFGFAEARDHLMEQIRPLLLQVSETILPDFARATFAAHLTDTIGCAFEEASDRPIHICVAPEIIDDVNEALASAAGTFIFVADPEMVRGQARLRRDDTHVMIDFPALLDALQAALNGLEPSERTQSNG